MNDLLSSRSVRVALIALSMVAALALGLVLAAHYRANQARLTFYTNSCDTFSNGKPICD